MRGPRLHEPLVGNIEKDSVSLDIERNFTKSEPDVSLMRVDCVFGLVEKFTGETTRQSQMATTLLKGVLTSGTLCDANNMTLTLQCYEDNIIDLPSSFGGTSGGGLWRDGVRRSDDGSFETVYHRLIGIASNEDQKKTPSRIICQNLELIRFLLEKVRDDLRGRKDYS